MKIKLLKMYVAFFLIVLCFLIGYLLLCFNNSLSMQKWIQGKVDITWPDELPRFEISERSWLFARASYVEAHFVLPQKDVKTILDNQFTGFDPLYDCKWTVSCERDNMDWKKWRNQKVLFGTPARFDYTFKNRGTKAGHIMLSTNYFYRVGNITGSNPYAIVVDNTTGNTWIRIDTP